MLLIEFDDWMNKKGHQSVRHLLTTDDGFNTLLLSFLLSPAPKKYSTAALPAEQASRRITGEPPN
jgi:hypothetical protein